MLTGQWYLCLAKDLFRSLACVLIGFFVYWQSTFITTHPALAPAAGQLGASSVIPAYRRESEAQTVSGDCTVCRAPCAAETWALCSESVEDGRTATAEPMAGEGPV